MANEFDEREAMYCQDIISEDDLRGFLNWMIINPDDISDFAAVFENGVNGGKTEYLVRMFLLYNEYLGSDWKDEDIARFSNIMKSPYAAIRPKFVRNGIITLDLGNYSSSAAIDSQINALDAITSDDEKKFMKIIFGDDSVRAFFRYPDERNSYMRHAIAERTDHIGALSKILNCRYSDQLTDKLVTEKNRDTLESIFEKIRSGTIH